MAVMNDFFDSYPEFYKTSPVGTFPNRLNHRYKALIENNKQIIRDATILDLASHDGRWSFPALMSGASKVIGIEGRSDLVENCIKTMKKHGISDEKYSFIIGNIFDEIENIREKIDVVFCFGIFYHVMNHMSLLSLIKKLEPRYVIMDSYVSNYNDSVIELRLENTFRHSAAIQTNVKEQAVVGRPSKKAIELMLSYFDFDYSYYDWQNSGITNWENIEDYRRGNRITLLAKNNSSR